MQRIPFKTVGFPVSHVSTSTASYNHGVPHRLVISNGHTGTRLSRLVIDTQYCSHLPLSDIRIEICQNRQTNPCYSRIQIKVKICSRCRVCRCTPFLHTTYTLSLLAIDMMVYMKSPKYELSLSHSIYHIDADIVLSSLSTGSTYTSRVYLDISSAGLSSKYIYLFTVSTKIEC